MVKIRVIHGKKFFKGKCCFCQEASTNHTIKECEDFKSLLQMMMDQGEINVITDAMFMGESSSRGLKPLIIFFENVRILVTNMTMHPPKLTVEVLSLFPYSDNKMVPWNYNCNYVNESTTKNISCIEGMT